MRTISSIFFMILAFLPLKAQESNDSTILRNEALNLFLDCMSCDVDYIRQEMQFVNYVRDRKEAQVHLMVTSQRTGSGGREYSFHFLGQKEFTGKNDTLKYISNSNSTEDEVRKGQTHTMKLGLIPYIIKTPIASKININYQQETTEEVIEDKWNNWVFSAGLSGYASGQQSYQSSNLSGEISANRITEDWKQEFELDYTKRFSRFETSSGTINDQREYFSFESLIVKSLNDHWSAGGEFEINSSTYSNYDLNLEFAPGIEYDIFPYSESTRKQLRILYMPGIEFNRYTDTTIYNKTEEFLALHRLEAAFQINQKWGSISTSLSWKNYFHDWSINNLDLFTSMNIRIVKGLQFSLGASASLIHDQINLPKGGASDEEILLRRKELKTSFEYFTHFSISYTFGSIYNNIVNPRFGGSGGMYIMY